MPTWSKPMYVALTNSPQVWTVISFLWSSLNSKSTRCSQAHLSCNVYLPLLETLKLMYPSSKPNRILLSAFLPWRLHTYFTFALTSVQLFSSNYSPSSVGWNSQQVRKLQSTEHIPLAACPFKIQVVNWLPQFDLDKIHAAVSHSTG